MLLMIGGIIRFQWLTVVTHSVCSVFAESNILATVASYFPVLHSPVLVHWILFDA